MSTEYIPLANEFINELGQHAYQPEIFYIENESSHRRVSLWGIEDEGYQPFREKWASVDDAKPNLKKPGAGYNVSKVEWHPMFFDTSEKALLVAENEIIHRKTNAWTET